MRAKIPIALALLLVALPAAAGMSVKVDSEPGCDFTRFRTFAWADMTSVVAKITHERILAAVNRELTARGLVATDRDPDVLVSYDGSATEEVQPAEFVRGYGHGAIAGPGWYSVPEKRYRKGTLILSIADARGEKLVWRGSASDAVKEQAEKNLKKVDEAVRKLLAKFPPSAAPQATKPAPK